MNRDPDKLCSDAAGEGAVELTAIQAARYFVKHRERRSRDVLQVYANLEVSAGHLSQPRFLIRTLGAPEVYVPKLLWMASKIVERDEKTVVLLKAHTGFAFFKVLLEDLRDKADLTFGIAGQDDMAAFNCRETNLRGERYRVFIGDTAKCGEGVSFRNVRSLYLGDVPQNATELEQRVARVDRGDGHRGLPRAERTVRVHMSCARLPAALKTPLGSWLWRERVGTSPYPRSPELWQRLVSRIAKHVEDVASLGVDPSDPECLVELKQLCQENPDVLPKRFQHLARVNDAALRNLVAGLCCATVDELLVKELGDRCRCVRKAHAPLQRSAMGASWGC